MLFKTHRAATGASILGSLSGEDRPAALHLFDPRNLHPTTRRTSEAVIRRLCANAYLGEATSLCRVLGRYKMYVDTGDVGISSHLLLDGFWEMWVTEVLVDIVRPGMVAVDVGANLGYFTLLLADLVGPQGAVYAFEPNPPIAERLRRNVEVNGFRSTARVCAEPLGAEDGQVVALAAPEGGPGGAHIFGDVSADGALLLQTRRFDSYPELLQADVIKIDAEGAERDIWRGMAGLFERRERPLTVLLEFATVRYDDPRAFLNEITAAGFSLGEATVGNGACARTADEILESPLTEQMLVLRR